MKRRTASESPSVDRSDAQPASRRGFLKASVTAGWTALGAASVRLAFAGPEGTGAARGGKMYALIYFDTEDFVSPPDSPSHTLPGQLADVMHKHGLQA